MILDGMCKSYPQDIDDALAAVRCLLSAPQLEKEYELKCALHEIGQILCKEKLCINADMDSYQNGLTEADLRRLSDMINQRETP